MSILLYGCTTWTLTKGLEKKLDDNYTRMLRTILNKSWRQHPTRHQLYSHLPPITKTISLSGNDQIKMGRDLKDINFIITLFRVSWEHTAWQYFYIQSMEGPRPGNRKYSPLHIYKCSQIFKKCWSEESVGVSWSEKATRIRDAL